MDDIQRAAINNRRGAAMVETALLCFFLYVPVLMMVIVWGDMTLDKQRAHMSAAYRAFKGEEADEDEVRQVFFPGATGRADATGAVRRVEMNPLEEPHFRPGPEFTLPSSRSGDYSSAEEPPFDIHYKLYSMAAGDIHVTRELQALPDGGVGFVSEVHRDENDMARYLTREGIVEMDWDEADLDSTDGSQEDAEIEMPGDSRDYTGYAVMLTRLLNGQWGGMDNALSRRESVVALNTRFNSPFLTELERESTLADSPEEADYVGGEPLPRVGGQPGFEMQFGPGGERDLADDSFQTGYTYLRARDAGVSADNLWEHVNELDEALDSPKFVGDEDDVTLAQMGRSRPRSTEKDTLGEDDMLYLEPGDPRPEDDDND